jgi:hypothetical protein
VAPAGAVWGGLNRLLLIGQRFVRILRQYRSIRLSSGAQHIDTPISKPSYGNTGQSAHTY